MHSVIQDLRYSARQALNNPGFTLTATISLALGIGAATAVFSVVYAALINPYPYPEADRIVRLAAKTNATRSEWLLLNGHQVKQLQQSPVVESVLAMDYHAMTMTGPEYPENVRAVALISTGFRDLGVPAFLGRGLTPSDAVDGQEPNLVTVLSYKFWQTHYFGDRSVIGKQLELDHRKYLVVGVAAPRFTWYNPDLWIPLPLPGDPARRLIIDFFLKPGLTFSAADAALQPLMEQIAKEAPKQFPEHFKVRVEGLNEWVTQSISGTLYLLLGAVMLLLSIGCGNVSILLLARGTARQHELSVRAAVGADRKRLVRQLLTESLLLSLAGATLGIAFSFGILAGIKLVLPRYAFAPEVVIHINLPVLFFSIVVAVVTGVLFGLWPAIRLSRSEIGRTMQSGVRRVSGSVEGRRTHQVLVSGQIALTLLLLSGAGAALNGFIKVMRAPLGYDPHDVMSVPIPLRDNSFTTWQARENYYENLRTALTEVHGVILTAISSNATPPRSGWQAPFEIAGKPLKEQPTLSLNLVSPQYFGVLRIPLMEGRLWTETENHACAHVLVVNRAFARRYFPNGDAIGHKLKLPSIEDRPPLELAASQIASTWLTIVGVVADARDDGLRNPIKPAAYVPDTVSLSQFTQVLMRSVGPPLQSVKEVHQRLAKLNPDQQTFEVQDLESWISDEPEWQQEHLAAWIFGVFAALALMLAGVGLYSVVSYSVAQRTNEFGIRMALGAEARDILRHVFGSMLPSVGTGVFTGLLLAISIGGFVQEWAGGDSRDPLMIFGGTALLCAVAIFACAMPARHATRIEPMSALRFD